MPADALPPGDTTPVERRLSTILVADVYGYSRMMGENEERTVQTLRGHRAIFDEMLRTHRGRMFNTAGDAILAEFGSAVEAVRCATEIQAALRTRNEHLPADQQMWFRIGINLGDVVVQGGDLLGDGVNVAARIQSVAEPGGTCISGSVFDQIQNKLTLPIRQMGERTFKNIARPVRTFAIGDGETGAAAKKAWQPRAGSRGLIVSLVVIVAGIASIGYWLYRENTQREAEVRIAADQQRKAEQAAVAEKEARLAAELKSAQDALAAAEASKRKAEQDAAAQKEAKLAGELRAAKEALAKAAVPPPAAAPATAAKAADKASEARADRYDGVYVGRICKVMRDGSNRCIPVSVTAQHGTLSAAWTNRLSGAKAQATGSIAPDGAASLSVDAFDPTGAPVKGTLTGRWSSNTLNFTGTWSDGTSGTASLGWAPEGSTAGRAPGARRTQNN